jgi:SAM-dependent methyltransferase
MAISETHYKLLRELKSRGVLPQGGSILEIGQANWYGDMDPEALATDAKHLFREGESLPVWPLDAFAAARLVYAIAFSAVSITAIDGDPAAPDSFKYDLNQPVTLPHQFDTAINHGTAEHIFNIAQVFATVHQWTKPGGLMIHESPFTGWVDHGFYCLQPTLFWDVAAANGYSFELVAIEHLASKSVIHVESREQILELARRDQLPNNAMLFVVMRKGAEESPFRVPMQGVYAGGMSDTTQQAWRDLR